MRQSLPASSSSRIYVEKLSLLNPTNVGNVGITCLSLSHEIAGDGGLRHGIITFDPRPQL